MIAQRLKESLGMIIIGDGVLALVAPHRHPGLWLPGPPVYQQGLQALRSRPVLKRFLGVAQVGIGIWLASQQWQR